MINFLMVSKKRAGMHIAIAPFKLVAESDTLVRDGIRPQRQASMGGDRPPQRP
jgi:hypothetical protein